MTRQIYLNGRYLSRRQARVPVEDRGFMMGDGVYEVFDVFEGRLVEMDLHIDRLERSLTEIKMSPPASRAVLRHIIREIIRRNRLHHGHVYLQVTRGVAKRDFIFPPADTPTTLLCMTYRADRRITNEIARKGIAVKSMPDQRWKRRDIKTILLLPSSIARQAAHEEGAREAWLIDEKDYVTEGSSSNAWILTGENLLVTRQADHDILRGITRQVVLRLCEKFGIELEERPFTLKEAFEAREAFITASTNVVMPVVMIDGRKIASGTPGKIASGLREAFHKNVTLTG